MKTPPMAVPMPRLGTKTRSTLPKKHTINTKIKHRRKATKDETHHDEHSKEEGEDHDDLGHMVGTFVGVIAGFILLIGHLFNLRATRDSRGASHSLSIHWLIVGGGIHGVHIAARLIGEAGVDQDRVRIVDPAETLLHRWRTCTEITGMRHLVRHRYTTLDLSAWSLRQFADTHTPVKRSPYARPYMRPSLSLFNHHCGSRHPGIWPGQTTHSRPGHRLLTRV